jgi:hypothetical protein
LDLQLLMQSVPITTNFVSSNPAYGELYSIQVCQWHAAGRWFSPDTPFSSTNKIDTHDRNKILLTVALNTIALVIALTITIIFLNVNFLLFKLFSFYFLLNWYFVRMINFACSYSILSRNNVSISGPFALITHSPWVR